MADSSDTGGAGKIVLSIVSILVLVFLMATSMLHGLLALALVFLVVASIIAWWLWFKLETLRAIRKHDQLMRNGDLRQQAAERARAAKRAHKRGEAPPPLMYQSFDAQD